jgi:hypothetical protein
VIIPHARQAREDQEFMDGSRFDELIKDFSRRRLTRLRALQGVAAAAVVSLTGARLATDGTDAADRDRRRRKRTICHCGDNNPQQVNCETLRLRRKRAKRHLRRHQYDYKGECRKNPAPVGCDPRTQTGCAAGQVCNAQAICVSAGCLNSANPQCAGGETCCAAGTGKAGECKPNANAC